MAKSDPDCGHKYTRENFTQYNTHLHHNCVHDTRRGEGFYIGYFKYGAATKLCNGEPVALLPHELRGVHIHDNIVERAASDGLQLGCAVEDVEVHGNLIDGYALAPFQPYQNNGRQIGDATTGRWHDNVIRNGVGGGNAFIVGGPNVKLYHNVFENTGGIYFHNGISAGSEVVAVNNTFVRTTQRGFERGLQNADPSKIKIYNDIMVHDSTVEPIPSWSGFTASNNLFTTDEAAPRFVNSAAGDFRLRADAPARDAGADLSAYSPFQNNAFCLAVGNFAGHMDYSSAGVVDRNFNLLCVDGKGSGAFAFEAGGVSSANYAADGTLHSVSYFLNGSSATLGYRGPDGNVRSLGPGRVAVWVGTPLQIDGVLASKGSGSALTDFRMFWGSPDTGTWELDNLVVQTTLPQ